MAEQVSPFPKKLRMAVFSLLNKITEKEAEDSKKSFKLKLIEEIFIAVLSCLRMISLLKSARNEFFITSSLYAREDWLLVTSGHGNYYFFFILMSIGTLFLTSSYYMYHHYFHKEPSEKLFKF